MRLINLIASSLWIFPSCLHYAVKCNYREIFPYDDSECRVVFTNLTHQPEPIAINPPTYHEFICNSEFFIDNTKFIQYVERYGNLVVLLPRRFGKSLNLQMVKCFYEIPIECIGKICKPVPKEKTEAYQIFQKGLLTTCANDLIVKLQNDLQINSTNIMRRMNNQPVLFVTFQKMEDIHEWKNGLNEIYHYIIKQFSNAYSAHYYLDYYFPQYSTLYQQLINPPKEEVLRYDLIQKALPQLISMMRIFFKKPVMLLIDEYDSILNTIFLSEIPAPERVKNNVVRLFGELYGSLLKGNTHVRKAYLTGIIPSALASWIPATIITIMDRPINYYGFSKVDLLAMYEHFTRNCQNLTDTKDDLIKYYDGYLFGDNIKRYNPISVACYFRNPFTPGQPRLRPHWGETGDASDFLRQFIKYSNFARSFLNLLLPGGVYKIQTPERSLLSLQAMKSISSSFERAISLPHTDWYNVNYDDIDSIFLFLYATGYLTKSDQSNNTILILQIPNQEVRGVLWQNYANVQTGKPNNDRYKCAMETFSTALKKFVETNETDCTDLNKYFGKVLLELPPFTKTEFGGDNVHCYTIEGQIESTFSGVLNSKLDQWSREEQHDFRASKNLPDKRITGRPDTIVLHEKTITLFEFKLASNFDKAYIQSMKYVHLFFNRNEYKDITQIKVIPFVTEMDKSVRSNATICTRKAFNTTEQNNLKIREELTEILHHTGITPQCNSTCIRMLDWTYWNCVAQQSQFDDWKSEVIENCKELLTDKMTYFRTK